MLLSIFSCACWPFIYLLWHHFCSYLLSIFWLICLYSFLSSKTSLYIPDILHICYKYFIPACCLSFHFLHGIFWSAKVFNVDEVQFVRFFFYGLCFWCCKEPLLNFIISLTFFSFTCRRKLVFVNLSPVLPIYCPMLKILRIMLLILLFLSHF